MSEIEVQLASFEEGIPPAVQLTQWAQSVLAYFDKDHNLVIRIVDAEESARFNKTYRHRTGPTNVLSFPFEVPQQVPINMLGDLMICAPVVFDEAQQQHKFSEAHFAHMVVHGILHLLGYDHVDEACEMENLEIKILADMGYSNPYKEVVLV